MAWPNQAWPNQAWPNQASVPALTRFFNCAASRNFPASATVGDLWFATDTKDLFMAVAAPHQFFQGITDSANVTRVWELGLTILAAQRSNVPVIAPVGTIYLTTDSLEALAGTGVSLVKFRLNVARALGGKPTADLSGFTKAGLTASYFVPLAT